MLTVDFKSINIAKYEKSNTSIYNAIGYTTYLASEFLKVATGCFDNDEAVMELLDSLKAEKGGIVGVVDYLIDLCEAGGFFTYLTGAEVKEVAKKQLEKAKRLSLLSEEEKAREAAKLVISQLTGMKNGTK